MKISINKKIVWVHLTSKIWQTAVAVLGVTFGVSMYIFMNSFMNGVNNTQDNLAFSTLAHIRIYNDGNNSSFNPAESNFQKVQTVYSIRNHKNIQYTDGIKNTAKIIDLLKQQDEIECFTRQLNFSVFFRNGSKKINGLVSGVEVENENKLFGNSKNIIRGEWNKLNYQKSGIVLGKVLAENLGVEVNDNVNVLTSDGISKNYVVVGIIQTSIKEVDKSKAYINIVAARQLLSKNFDFASDILINIKNREQTESLVNRLNPAINFQVESWQTANEQLVATSELRNIIAVAVSLTILLVAGFGIYNIMNMTINEKIKEIAILKAMGFSGNDVKSIFLLHSAAIGLVGSFFGVILGYQISNLVNKVPFEIAGLTTLPIFYKPSDFIFATFFGIITTLIAGYLPSRKASKIDPVIIIRG